MKMKSFLLFLSLFLIQVPVIFSSLFYSSKLAAISIASLSLNLPFGNISPAFNAILKDSQSALCSLDTQMTDDFHGSCQQLDRIVRSRAGKLLILQQDWGGSASTGAAVWQGANMAGWYMENVIGKDKMKDMSVLDLGSGVGFTSLIANALGASEVVITDGNTDVLKIADKNIEINIPVRKSKDIYTSQLRWNIKEDEEKYKLNNRNQPWDYIIAADVTYLKKNRFDLISSIVNLSGPNTISMLSFEPRSVGEVEDVLSIVEELGLSWREESLPVDKVKSQCNLMCARMFLVAKNPTILNKI